MKQALSIFQLGFTLLSFLSACHAIDCPPVSDSLPAPRNFSGDSTSLSTAQANLTASIATLINAALNGTDGSPADTFFSVEVYSVYDEQPLFTAHYNATDLPEPTEGVSSVDSDSIYRIGSISKLWTVYLWLVAVGDAAWNDPITKYVPELEAFVQSNPTPPSGSPHAVSWDSITVGALASQLAGVGRDVPQAPELDALITTAIGLPSVPPPSVNITYCGSIATLLYPCERSDFFDSYLTRPPAVSPYNTPIYSNAAFAILGYALENITSTPFPDLLSSTILEPLGLNSSSYGLPASNDSAIIPIDATTSGYTVDLRGSSPMGGFYSSLNDLRTIGTAMLNSTQLPSNLTRKWFKPTARIPAGTSQAAGAPWEIVLGPTVDNAVEHKKWIYTKAGNIGVYSTLVGFMPDYAVGFTVLAAGPSSAIIQLLVPDLIANTYMPALEAKATEEASQTYTGTFTNSTTNATISMTAEAYGDGLTVTSFTYNTTNIFDLIIALVSGGADVNPADYNVTVNLFPTGVTSSSGDIVEESWRAIFDVTPLNEPDTNPTSLVDRCFSWFGVDAASLGGYGFDDFLVRIQVGANGERRAVGVESRSLRIVMARE